MVYLCERGVIYCLRMFSNLACLRFLKTYCLLECPFSSYSSITQQYSMFPFIANFVSRLLFWPYSNIPLYHRVVI